MSKKSLKNKNKTMDIAIILILILIISSLSVVVYYIELPGEKEEIVTVKEVDDRISPFTNQGVFLRIHRIRCKGIIDHMENAGSGFVNSLLTPKDIKIDSDQDFNRLRLLNVLDGIRPGFGWDVRPSFYYVTVLDGYEFEGRMVFNSWDSGYVNHLVFRNVSDEQPTTDVEIRIVEKKEEKKLIGTRMVEEEMECFRVTYDFRNGSWCGDDCFNDSDGYGHFDGSNYEVWFSISQTSADMDLIPFWTEVNVLGTDPLVDDTFLDPDGDGVPTVWEWRWGYDPLVWDNHSFLDPDCDGLQNVEEFMMEEWLADPFYPEVYLEVDYMEQTPKKLFNKLKNSRNSGFDGWEHVFYFESQQMLIERFNMQGISVHIDDGRMGGGGDILPFGRGNGAYEQHAGVVAGFYANNFADERKGVFRYAVIAYGGGWCHPQDSNHFYDCICVPHNFNFFKNQLGFAITERTKRIGQALQMLHELGHSFDFHGAYFGGVDNSIVKAGNPPDYPWFDYVSCMNYDYFWLRYFDYSDGTNGNNDTDDWGLIDLTFFLRPSNEMEGVGFGE